MLSGTEYASAVIVMHAEGCRCTIIARQAANEPSGFTIYDGGWNATAADG